VLCRSPPVTSRLPGLEDQADLGAVVDHLETPAAGCRIRTPPSGRTIVIAIFTAAGGGDASGIHVRSFPRPRRRSPPLVCGTHVTASARPPSSGLLTWAPSWRGTSLPSSRSSAGTYASLGIPDPSLRKNLPTALRKNLPTALRRTEKTFCNSQCGVVRITLISAVAESAARAARSSRDDLVSERGTADRGTDISASASGISARPGPESSSTAWRTGLAPPAARDWRADHLESLGQDVRNGLRALRRGRGMTVMAVVSLALGIGANTASSASRMRSPERLAVRER